MTYTATIIKYTENQETGMANAEVEIFEEGVTDPIGNMTVSDTIANIHTRIKTDLAQVTQGHMASVETVPQQTTFLIGDDGIVS